MDHVHHQMILDYQNGGVQARCSCGKWIKPTLVSKIQRLREIYGGIEKEHHCHVDAAEKLEPALA